MDNFPINFTARQNLDKRPRFIGHHKGESNIGHRVFLGKDFVEIGENTPLKAAYCAGCSLKRNLRKNLLTTLCTRLAYRK